jgi:hypothetical protein
MPIRPERKHLYPDNWDEISEYIRFERAGGKCEWCGIEHKAKGYRDEKGDFHTLEDHMIKQAQDCGIKVIRIILTTAHIDHDETNCDYGNLAALCQKCHNGHDAQARANGIADRREDLAGQMKMFEEEDGETQD